MRKTLTLTIIAIIALIGLSTNVQAANVTTESELADAITAGTSEIVVGADITINTTIRSSKDVTLDLNGYKITGPDDGASNWYAFVVEDGTFTLKDTSAAQTGEIYAKCYGIETKAGKFVMESGKITATKNGTLGAAVVNYGGKVEIKGGTLIAAAWALEAEGYFSEAEVVISGGTFETTNTQDYSVAVQIGGSYSQKAETVTISGGTFKGTNAFAVDTNADVKITGGKFSSDISEYLDSAYVYDEETGAVICAHKDLEEHKAVEATYEKEGSKAYWSCKKCGKWFEDKDAIKEITDKDSIVIAKLVKDEVEKEDEKIEDKEDKTETDKKKEEEKDGTPNTGGVSIVVPVLSIVLVSAVVLVATKKGNNK